MTRLQRAIDELRKAAAGRPFVLVVDRSSPAAEIANVTVETPEAMATYVARGLLAVGDSVLERWSARYDAELREEDDDEEGEA